MTEIEYAGYSFTQSNNTDRYRIRNSRGQIVERGWEKPNMSKLDALRVIKRYLAVHDAVAEMRGR